MFIVQVNVMNENDEDQYIENNTKNKSTVWKTVLSKYWRNGRDSNPRPPA